MFGRRKNSGSGGAVPAFWQWWSEARDRVAAAIERGDSGSLAGEINGQVNPIDAGLEWELAPGRRSKHALIVSSAGNPALRATTARWLAAAPPADEVWEYHAARQPDPGVINAQLQFDEHRVALGDIRFEVQIDDDHACLDVRVYHPAFAQLPDERRFWVAFMSLTWMLGEEVVEQWVGPIEAVLTEPDRSTDVDGLIVAATELAERYREEKWVIMEAEREDGPRLMAVAARPLRAARWPRFDTHVAVELPYVDRGNGLPTDASLDQMRAAEDDVAAAIGADGALVAHASTAGTRTLHFYVDGVSDAANRANKQAKSLRVKLTTTYDPDFEQVNYLS